METKHVESLEEIIFKDRNKEYGAYSLRKNYGNHILVALFIAVFFAGIVLTYSLMQKQENIPVPKKQSITVISEPFLNNFKDPLPLPPPPPPSQGLRLPSKTPAFTVPQVTDEPINTDFGNQAKMADNPPNPVPPPGKPPVTQPSEPGPDVVPAIKQAPVSCPEVMPQFPGGESAMKEFLRKNIKYPEEAKSLFIQGVVYLFFIVETDGSLSEISVQRGIGFGCEDEAIRVMKNMPPWIPGKQNGNPVRVKLSLPVKFILQ